MHSTPALTFNPAAAQAWLRQPSGTDGCTQAESLGIDEDLFGRGLEGFLATIDDLLAAGSCVNQLVELASIAPVPQRRTESGWDRTGQSASTQIRPTCRHHDFAGAPGLGPPVAATASAPPRPPARG